MSPYGWNLRGKRCLSMGPQMHPLPHHHTQLYQTYPWLSCPISLGPISIVDTGAHLGMSQYPAWILKRTAFGKRPVPEES